MTEYDHIVLGMSLFNLFYHTCLAKWLIVPEEEKYIKEKYGIKRVDNIFDDKLDK